LIRARSAVRFATAEGLAISLLVIVRHGDLLAAFRIALQLLCAMKRIDRCDD
jgi:hypothetical protein